MPQLDIDVRFKLAQLQDGLDKMEKRTQQTARKMSSAFSSLGKVIAGLGIALSARAFANFIQSGIDAADNLAKLAQRVGVTVESLSALQYAADLAGVSNEELTTGLRQLAKNAADVQIGTGEAIQAFDALKISVDNGKGSLKSTEELLLEIADKFATFEDGANKTALAMRIFGRAGAQLIPFLNAGRAGFEQLRAEAERLGLVISGEAAKAAEDFNDNITKLTRRLDALKIALGGEVVKAFDKFIERMVLATKVTGSFWKALALVFATGTGDVADEVDKIETKIASLEDTLDALKGRGDTGIKGRILQIYNADDIKIVEVQLAALRTQLELLKKLSPVEIEFEHAGSFVPPTPAPGLADTRGKVSPFEQARLALEKQLEATQDLTESEKVLAAIQSGRIKGVTEAQKTLLIDLANQIDLNKENQEVEKLYADLQKERADAQKAETLRLYEIGEAIKDTLDPQREQIRNALELQQVFEKGFLTAQQYFDAMKDPAIVALLREEITLRDKLNKMLQEGDISLENYKKALEKLNEQQKETSRIGEEVGFVLTSAFSDAIISGGKLSDVFKALVKDLAQLILKYTILEPLAQKVKEAFEGTKAPKLSGGGGGGSIFDIIFGGVGKLVGLQHGGSFDVGGVGGTDSQVVAFRATPGENVTVNPTSMDAKKGEGKTVQFFVDNRGASVEAVVRLERFVAQLNGSIEQRAIAAVGGARARGSM